MVFSTWQMKTEVNLIHSVWFEFKGGSRTMSVSLNVCPLEGDHVSNMSRAATTGSEASNVDGAQK